MLLTTAFALALSFTAAAAPPDPLADLNASFAEAYTRGKADARADPDPVLLLAGDQLLLCRNGIRPECTGTSWPTGPGAGWTPTCPRPVIDTIQDLRVSY